MTGRSGGVGPVSSVLVAATAAFASVVAVAQPAPRLPAGRGIRAVDFENFTYNPSCAVTAVRVTGGEHVPKGPSSRLAFRVVGVTYGDLTGDGREEAVVTTSCSTGGSGVFSEGEIYALEQGGPVLLARLPGGDRAFGGIAGVRAGGGALVVSRFAPETASGPACCPAFVETSSYRLESGALVQVGGSERVPYQAPEARPAAAPGSVTGTVTFRGQADLPTGSEVTARVVDATDPDSVSIVAEQRTTVSGRGPFRFEIRVDPAAIRATRHYAVEVTVAVAGKVRWASLDPPPILTGGNPSSVEVVVDPI